MVGGRLCGMGLGVEWLRADLLGRRWPRTRIARHRVRWGIGMFVEDGAYTTVASAVAMLMALTLVFSATFAVWSAGRSADVQVPADATALAGANAVSSYHAVATVVDASILSLGLTGFTMAGVGMVGSFVPGVQTAAQDDAGRYRDARR